MNMPVTQSSTSNKNYNTKIDFDNQDSSILDQGSNFRENSVSQALANSVQQNAQQNPNEFRIALDQAFGGKADPAALDNLVSLAKNGELPLPANVIYVNAGELGDTAMGAYDSANGGTIYLDRRLLSDPKALESVYAEELGHHLDNELGGQDAAGDEGAIFSKSLLQGKVNGSELQALKSENDNGYINIDGKRIAVEFNGYSGPGSSVGTGGSDSSTSSSSTGSSGYSGPGSSSYTGSSDSGSSGLKSSSSSGYSGPGSSSYTGGSDSGSSKADDSEAEPASYEGNSSNESAAAVGRGAAAGRESFFNTQNGRAYDIGRDTPLTDYDGEVRRAAGQNHATYADFTYSDVGGRFARPGQTISYNSETETGTRAELAHYPGENNPTGMSNQTVVRSNYSGRIVDVVDSPQITAGALSEPFGSNGRDRALGSIITGEDPYAHTRQFSDGARAQGAEAMRVPANDGHVNLNLIPESHTAEGSLQRQFEYLDQTHYDANGVATHSEVSQNVQTPPAGNVPGRNISNTGEFPGVQSRDAEMHSRAGGARYGAAGAATFSTINALSDGDLTLQETGDIAVDTAVGTGAAIASDAAGSRLGMVKGGAVVDGAIAVGTSIWNNADAVESGEMSAGDATADVVVDTGVAVTAGLTGMAAGAAAGSVVPVVGTAVGAGVGFVAGAGGAWVATKTLEDFTDIGDNLREGLGDFLEDNFEEPLDAAWENVADAQDAAVEFASDTRDAAVDIVSDGIDSAEEALSEAGDALGNIGSRFKSWFD